MPELQLSMPGLMSMPTMEPTEVYSLPEVIVSAPTAPVPTNSAPVSAPITVPAPTAPPAEDEPVAVAISGSARSGSGGDSKAQNASISALVVAAACVAGLVAYRRRMAATRGGSSNSSVGESDASSTASPPQPGVSV